MSLQRLVYLGPQDTYYAGLRAEVADDTELVATDRVGTAEDVLATDPVGVVVVDLPHVSDPVDTVRTLTDSHPDVPVLLVVTGRTDPLVIFAALTAGAADYVERDSPSGRPARLVTRARAVAAGSGSEDTVRLTERAFTGEIEARRQTERRLTTVLDRIPDPVFYRDTDGVFLGCNAAFESLCGQSREAIVGQTTDELVDERLADICQRTDDEVLASREERRVETTVDREGERQHLRIHKAPFEDDTGSLAGVVGVVRDITEQRRTERELREQRENLEILNEVTRHDIRNDLQVVLGMADLLRDHVDEEGAAYLEMVTENARHAVDITQQARDLTETMLESGRETEPVSLRTTVESEIDKVRASYDRAVVTLDGEIPDCQVLADGMLSSVFRNLLANGIQHNDSDLPRLVVSAEASADSVTVRIADNGPGIADERKDEIFGRGEKGLESSGTGLGLYLVDTLIDQYGGEVRVEDADDGAAFAVTLRRADA